MDVSEVRERGLPVNTILNAQSGFEKVVKGWGREEERGKWKRRRGEMVGKGRKEVVRVIQPSVGKRLLQLSLASGMMPFTIEACLRSPFTLSSSRTLLMTRIYQDFYRSSRSLAHAKSVRLTSIFASYIFSFVSFHTS